MDKNTLEKVLKYGKEYEYVSDVPKELERGEAGDCFDVCLKNALKFPELKYVEGIAKDPVNKKEWLLHSWLTDGESVIDLTWRFENKETKKIFPIVTEYIGIEMDTKLVLDFFISTGYKSVLANHWRDKERALKILGFNL